jgi:transcriptional regulator with XRE-family HTH domain
MDDIRFGAAVRAIRVRKGWRQVDVAERARVSQSTVSRIERGHVGPLSIDAVRSVARALDIRVDLMARWRAGDLDRLLNARHSALHDAMARYFATRHGPWEIAPEVSFSIYGERGVIDIVAWHPGRRALLIIELKTDIADVNELMGSVDRKRRLAFQIARERGWDPAHVSVWVAVAASRTNRARVAAHSAVLRQAFPDDGRSVEAWLRSPDRPIRALSLWQGRGDALGTGLATLRRVRAPRAA